MPKTLGDLLGGTRQAGRAVDMSDAIRGLRTGRVAHEARASSRSTANSLRAFCLRYLPHHFTTGFGEHHDDLFQVIDAPRPRTGKRVARIEPRKFGKTTIISLAMPLQMLAFKKKKFILLVGESSGNADANLATLVHELENNDALLHDFPHLVPARDAKGQVVKWTDSQIVLHGNVTVMAKGMGSRMRGLKHGHTRPDLGIVDDPESPETAPSFLTRQRHKRWFGGTFLGLGGDEWDVYVIGNLPHHDCLIASLVKSDEWDGKLYRAVNIPLREDEKYPIGNRKTDGSPLWPEGWPMVKLDAYRADPTVGDLGFAREMMNDPRDDKDKPFTVANFTFFDYAPAVRTTYVQTCVFLDPAGGEQPGEVKRGRRDWACAVAMGRTADGFLDVFDVTMTKALPDAQVDRVLDMYESLRLDVIGMEENNFKNLIEPTLLRRARERQLYPATKTIYQTRNKLQRILKRQPVIANGTVRFARHLLTKVPDYFGQFDDFPGDHDDGPDATEGAVSLIEQARIIGLPTGVGGSSYWRSEAVS